MLKHLLGGSSNNVTDPERALNLYMEEASERLREFMVIVNQSESKCLSNKERMNGMQYQIERLRQDAEQAAMQKDQEKARKLLEQAAEFTQQLEEQKRNSSTEEETLRKLKEEFQFKKAKLDLAKERQQDLITRGKNAIIQRDMNKALSKIEQDCESVEKVKQEVFLSEAQAELSRSLDDEIVELMRRSNRK
ncbi:PspA/IM30 family protein [Brevibacillus ginsengisoli]|uniref:PspA/IM30 family protein n=1 Tax=Brevibacillus ginsengisoli TaxID=363854 RepID=UPI003CF72D9B